jgi:hypothetical protein
MNADVIQSQINEYIEIRKTENDIKILVCKIGWDGPAKMISHWEVEKKLDPRVSKTLIEKAVAQIFEDNRFFQTCSECKERKPIGLMWKENICQSCAANNHGVIF